MKNKFGLIFTSVLALSLGLTSLGTVHTFGVEEETMASSIKSDREVYELNDYIDTTINTFAAWIKLPTNIPAGTPGGIIMGNHLYSTLHPGTNDYAVDADGHFKLFYNMSGYVHSFNNTDLRNGNWTHVCLVRDKASNKLSFYVNGVLDEEIDIALPEAYAHVKYRIGMDQAQWYNDLFNEMESPFQGEIKQLSLFNNNLSVSEINSLMNTTEVTRQAYPGVITNLSIPSWGVENVFDTSNNIDATLVTYNKAVDVKETGEYDYSFVVVPDMQAMTYWKPANFLKQSLWITDNADALKIKFAMYLGDMTESRYSVEAQRAASIKEWGYASEFISMLDDKVPYTVAIGNHDYDDWAKTSRAATMFNKSFPYTKYKDFSYFGGAFEEGAMENTYSIIQVNEDIEYLIFALEEGPRTKVLNWVDRVIDAHPRSRVFITTHSYVSPRGILVNSTMGSSPSKTITYDDVNDADKMWEKCVSKHSNVVAVFSGHECCDDLVYRSDVGVYGNTVYSFLADLQGSIATCAMNTVLLVKVNEANKTWDLCFFWISENKCFNKQSQFQLSFADPYNPTVK